MKSKWTKNEKNCNEIEATFGECRVFTPSLYVQCLCVCVCVTDIIGTAAVVASGGGKVNPPGLLLQRQLPADQHAGGIGVTYIFNTMRSAMKLKMNAIWRWMMG